LTSSEEKTMEIGADWGRDGWPIPPGGGDFIQLGGPHRPEILVRGEEVGDALGAFVFHHHVIAENPPHAHNDFMKIAYVLEGEYHFRVGDAEFSGGPGTTVVVPRGSYHTFVTPTGGKLLFVSAPAGNEQLFVELGRLGSDPTPEQLVAVDERFATTPLPGDGGRPWRQLGLDAADSENDELGPDQTGEFDDDGDGLDDDDLVVEVDDDGGAGRRPEE
jgi:quercetin dioxygenase-like cupin family protein